MSMSVILYNILGISIPLALLVVIYTSWMSQLVYRYNGYETDQMKFLRRLEAQNEDIKKQNQQEVNQNDELKTLLLEIRDNIIK